MCVWVCVQISMLTQQLQELQSSLAASQQELSGASQAHSTLEEEASGLRGEVQRLTSALEASHEAEAGTRKQLVQSQEEAAVQQQAIAGG